MSPKSERNARRPTASKVAIWSIASIATLPLGLIFLLGTMPGVPPTNSFQIMFFRLVSGLPAMQLLGPMLAWIAWTCRWSRLTWFCLSLPLIMVILIVAMIVVASFASFDGVL